MVKVLRKALVLLVVTVFIIEPICYGLATLPASQNTVLKRGILIHLKSNLTRFAQTPDEVDLLKNNHTNCILLSSGQILINKEVLDNDIEFLQNITQEEIKAIMQILENEDRDNLNSKYNSIKKIVLNLFPTDNISAWQKDRYVIHTIASLFSWISLIENNLLTYNDVPDEIRSSVDKIYPLINGNRHSFFTKEFWNISSRSTMIRKAQNNGMTFYETSLFLPYKTDDNIYYLLEKLKKHSYIKKYKSPLSFISIQKINEIRSVLLKRNESDIDPLGRELYKLFTEVDNINVKQFNYDIARQIIIDILISAEKPGMEKLFDLFSKLEGVIPEHRYFENLLMIGKSNSPYVKLFIPFYINYFKKNVSNGGIIFRTNKEVNRIIEILDKCGEPWGFLRKLRICAEDHEDTDNTAVFTINISTEGTLRTETLPGLVMHAGGNVENYSGKNILAKTAENAFRGTIHGSTKTTDGFLRLDAPSGRLKKEEVEEIMRICNVLIQEVHPEKPFIIIEQAQEEIEKYHNITLPENLTLINFLLSVENLLSTPAIKKHHEHPSVKISPFVKISENKATATIKIKNKLGIHMTTANAIVSLMNRFPKTNAFIHKNAQVANTRDILDLQILAAGYGETIDIISNGPRAKELVTVIIQVINEADKHKEALFEKIKKFPVRKHDINWMKDFIQDHPEILDTELLVKLSDKLIQRIIADKWPWHKETGKQNNKFYLSAPIDNKKSLKTRIQKRSEKPSSILQIFLNLHDNPYCKIIDPDWHRTVKDIIADFLKTNIELSSEEHMAVFGICISTENNTPIKFMSKPSRFKVRTSRKSKTEHAFFDGFIKEAPEIIRGTIAETFDNAEGFVRLDASSYDNPHYLTTQIRKIVDYLIEIKVNPKKGLVFPEQTRVIINNVLDITLPEEFSLEDFKNIYNKKDYVPEKKQIDRTAASGVFGLPVRQEILIDIPRGIHAKTAIYIVEIAKHFDTTKIFIRKENKIANASSRVELMQLGVGRGEEVEILAVGPGAQTALDKVIEFLKDGKTSTKEDIIKELPNIFKKWQESGVRLYRKLQQTHDIKSTKVLFADLLHKHLNSNRIYKIKYDISRLSPEQLELVEIYAKVLRKRSKSNNTIRLNPFSSEKTSDKNKALPLFSVSCYIDNKSLGESNIFVTPEKGDIKDYILRIPGLLNIAFASSNIETNLTETEIESEYGPLIGFIKTQCILILGEEHFTNNIVTDIKNIRLILPKVYKHNYVETINEYNRETIEILKKA